MRKRIALFALALTLALPGSALAATSSETLTVFIASLSITAPASVSYGTVAPGAEAQSAFQVTYSSNTAATVKLTATDLTGAGTIPASARSFVMGVPISDTFTGFTAGVPQTLLAISAPGATATVDVTAKVAVPGGAVAGVYSGSLLWVIE